MRYRCLFFAALLLGCLAALPVLSGCDLGDVNGQVGRKADSNARADDRAGTGGAAANPRGVSVPAAQVEGGVNPLPENVTLSERRLEPARSSNTGDHPTWPDYAPPGEIHIVPPEVDEAITKSARAAR